MNSSDTKNISIPKLRFPGFTQKDWRKISFINVSDKKIKWSFIGGPFGSNLQSSDYTENGVRIIQLQNIGDGEFSNDYQIFTSEEKADELLSCNIYPGDIIMSKMGDPVGRACLIPDIHPRYVMCSDGIRVVVDEKEFNKYFIYSLINSDLFRGLVEKTATGSTRKRIGLDDLKNLPMMVPADLDEQKKIADCLSALDELITAENQKLEALQHHKKGLIEQLFPADGLKVPKLRFKEFRNSGDWEEKPLGSLVEKVGSGVTPLGGDANYKKSGRPFVRSQNVGWGIFLLNDIAFIDEETHQDSVSTEIKTGDVLLNITGASIGRSAVANEIVNGGNVNQHVCIIRTIKTELNAFFLNQYLVSSYGQEQIDSFQAGGNRQGLNFAQIRSFSIPIPPKLEEQQKLADCLFFVDKLINEQSQKVESVKVHKKGLMQQLFPSTCDIETS
jgi:type I restriction enzyme S subunit